ncbi:MAG: glutaredoxin-related protein [Maribacter sp.]|jgi:glutaredoxin-related protein
MGNNSSFKDLTRRVTLYLDGELDTVEERELLQEIQLNPQYVQLLSKEQNFKEFIKSRLQRKTVSPTLIQSIKDKISTSI